MEYNKEEGEGAVKDYCDCPDFGYYVLDNSILCSRCNRFKPIAYVPMSQSDKTLQKCPACGHALPLEYFDEESSPNCYMCGPANQEKSQDEYAMSIVIWNNARAMTQEEFSKWYTNK